MNVEAGSHEFWGEGDERFFFDRATLPSVNGTGTEDYFSHGFGFREESSDPSMVIRAMGIRNGDRGRRTPWIAPSLSIRSGSICSLRATIAHGSVNVMEMGLSSAAACRYQTERTRNSIQFASVHQRMPISLWNIQDLNIQDLKMQELDAPFPAG